MGSAPKGLGEIGLVVCQTASSRRLRAPNPLKAYSIGTARQPVGRPGPPYLVLQKMVSVDLPERLTDA